MSSVRYRPDPPDKVFAIADCNNFYASCERVFRPELNGKPVVVLSNNDGCVIARSNEAKAIGIKMGAPFFQIERFAKQHSVAVLSSNYALYGDMSRRVMQVLAGFAPRIEVYSIDECFLDLTGLHTDLTDYCLEICAVVKQWTGIPISIGIAPSKTLAKLANRLAKSGRFRQCPVLDWRTVDDSDTVLAETTLTDLWGIAARSQSRLNLLGIADALALKQSDPKRLRGHFGVVMERIVYELRGLSCLDLEDVPAPRKQILTSRSFGEKLTGYDDLRAAVTYFATRSAEKCRQHKLAAHALTVFVETSPFDTRQPFYANSATFEFQLPTHDSAQLQRAAQRGLARIFRPGLSYQRAGVLLPELLPEGVAQLSLFSGGEQSNRSDELMQTLDAINRRYGRSSIRYAGEILSQRWRMRQQFKSPSYTTNIHELLTIRI